MTEIEKLRINIEIRRYKKTHEPIRVFAEIMKVDLTTKSERDQLGGIVRRISRLEDVSEIK